jgi:hypothetical protein
MNARGPQSLAAHNMLSHRCRRQEEATVWVEKVCSVI